MLCKLKTAATWIARLIGIGNVDADDEQVVNCVKSSNIDFKSSNPRRPGTWRWPEIVDVYIPEPSGDKERNYATMVNKSIEQINTKLHGLLELRPTNSPPRVNHIRVSYETSYVDPNAKNYQDYCANVSTGPNLGNVIQPDPRNGIASNPVWINLGNGRCCVTQDIVTHEFGHALGLAEHFNGFDGDGPAISSAFWDVLATLYNHPPSTQAPEITVKRAAS